jgi:hypothetical protein
VVSSTPDNREVLQIGNEAVLNDIVKFDEVLNIFTMLYQVGLHFQVVLHFLYHHVVSSRIAFSRLIQIE